MFITAEVVSVIKTLNAFVVNVYILLFSLLIIIFFSVTGVVVIIIIDSRWSD
jgi:hypothetical protein